MMQAFHVIKNMVDTIILWIFDFIAADFKFSPVWKAATSFGKDTFAVH
jgi:hypothetical protein